MGILTGNQKIVAETAQRIGIEPALALAIAETESSFDPFEIKNEEGYRYIIPKATRPNKSSVSTELTCQRLSWGIMQVMGATARELGFIGWIPKLTIPEIGAEYGCKYLLRQLKRYNGDVEKAVSAYNAGHYAPDNRDNMKYTKTVLVRLEKWRAQL